MSMGMMMLANDDFNAVQVDVICLGGWLDTCRRLVC